MRILALDIGSKKTGIAISDKTNTISFPYEVFSYKEYDYESLKVHIEKIIEKESITDLVIGRPVNMDGSCGFATKRFANEISSINGVKIHFIDERLTTKSSIDIIHSLGYKIKNKKDKLDIISATIILDMFLKGIKNEK